jgi:hypothetical protein
VAAREFAASIRHGLDAEGAEAFAALTELYLAERFGGRASPERSEEALGRLRRALRRSRWTARPGAQSAS